MFTLSLFRALVCAANNTTVGDQSCQSELQSEKPPRPVQWPLHRWGGGASWLSHGWEGDMWWSSPMPVWHGTNGLDARYIQCPQFRNILCGTVLIVRNKIFINARISPLCSVTGYSVSYPDSIRSVDPDSKFGSGFRRAKMTCTNRKKWRKFMFWSAGCSFLRAEGFFCSLDVFYGGLGIVSK